MADLVRMGTKSGRGVILATVLGSGITFLDTLVVNVALPKMDEQLDLGVAGMQWSVSGYLLTLSALLLLGGSLGDLYGRRRIYLLGIAVFAVGSIVCGLAPNAPLFVAARIVQGIGGALMVPASLAIIQSSFVEDDRGAAVGSWTGMSAFFTSIGPFVGGIFVTYISWRWAFFVNVPLAALTVWATLKFVPGNADVCPEERHPDYMGASLIALGLGGITYWAIEGPSHRTAVVPLVFGVAGLLLTAVFVMFERRSTHPMMPTSLFKNPQFNWINACTFLFYGAFATGVTLLGIRLQTGLGYSPLLSGIATLPVNFLIFGLSKRWGSVAQRIGARLPMTAAALIVAASLVWMSQVAPGHGYWTFVLPAILVWGIGLSMMVAPLTSAALAAADQRHIGVASAFNNAASRLGPSFTIALIPVLAGMSANGSLGGPSFENGYEKAMLLSAAVCVLPAVISALRVKGSVPHHHEAEPVS